MCASARGGACARASWWPSGGRSSVGRLGAERGVAFARNSLSGWPTSALSAGNLARASCGNAASEDSNMTDIGTSIPSGYISDAELIAWIEDKSKDQYDKVRGSMAVSEQRSELMNDLSQLKADIDAGKSASDIVDEMTAIRDEYADSPYAEELDGLLGDMQQRVDAGGLTQQEIKDQIADQDAILNDPDASDEEKTSAAMMRDYLFGQLSAAGTSSFKTEFSDKLKSEVEKLGRVDQLDLINIQEAMSNARQTSQLGSNIMASRDQASNAIVGNIRG
jgi:hypothetical protein